MEVIFFGFAVSVYNTKYKKKKSWLFRSTNSVTLAQLKMIPPETLKYWVGVQWAQSYLMGRRCLFSLGWPSF